MMYAVEHTIFGKWVSVIWTETFKEAMQSAQTIRESGWLNVRITNNFNDEIVTVK